jgi:hypothetical protein
MDRVNEILKEASPTAVAAHSFHLSAENVVKIGGQLTAQQFVNAVSNTLWPADMGTAQTIVNAGLAAGKFA